MPTTVTVTLGHTGLLHGPEAARADICHALRLADATILGRFHDGHGYWDDQSEPCDSWIVSIPDPADVDYLRATLARTAQVHGQEAIGLIVHNHTLYGPSYVQAAER